MTRRYSRSPEAAAYRRWYNTKRWREIRAAVLAAEPLCRMCVADGDVTVATICDHIEPHRGDEAKFWAGPFQPLCKPHHDITKQREEANGYQAGCDGSGMPIDPAHPWAADR